MVHPGTSRDGMYPFVHNIACRAAQEPARHIPESRRNSIAVGLLPCCRCCLLKQIVCHLLHFFLHHPDGASGSFSFNQKLLVTQLATAECCTTAIVVSYYLDARSACCAASLMRVGGARLRAAGLCSQPNHCNGWCL